MADGIPKDYSSIYCEDNIPAHRNINNNNITHHSSNNTINSNNGRPELPPIPSSRGHRRASYNKQLDGSFVAPKHNESNNKSVCLRQVVAKLNNLPKQYHDAYVEETLKNHHYVFVERRKTSFKAYIQYFDEKDTYVVRISQNTLKAVKDKMPKRGNYRYFFKGPENTCEEVEFDESVVPTLDKDGLKQIYCQVFPF